MINVKNEYNKRVSEIDIIYKNLLFIENLNIISDNSLELKDRIKEFNLDIDSNINIEVIFSNDAERIIKSNILLMLYNIVESTVKNSFLYMYDCIRFDQCNYNNASDEIKRVWKRWYHNDYFNLTTNFETCKNKSDELIEFILNEDLIELNKDSIGANGNLDLREIKEIMKKHGVSNQFNSSEQAGCTLLNIKNIRNDLAHGSKTFNECGADYSIIDIKNMIESICLFLDEFIEKIKNYLDSKNCLKQV